MHIQILVHNHHHHHHHHHHPHPHPRHGYKMIIITIQNHRYHPIISWLVVLTRLKKIVNGKDYPLYEMENKIHVPNMFQTTNQLSHDIRYPNVKLKTHLHVALWHHKGPP